MGNVLHVNELLQILEGDDLIKEFSENCQHITITGFSVCSKEVERGALFVCKGAAFKTEYLLSAVSCGASMYMSEQLYPSADIPYIIVNDIRKAMALAARWYYGCPGDSLTKIGVTGTKGKTTVTLTAKAILDLFTDKHCSAFSTHEASIGDREFETTLTTPEPAELQSYLSMSVSSGCTHAVMEVSSQAMKMNRVYGETYAVGIFTNIDRDHISPIEHSSMEEYLHCKVSFLRQCENVILFCGTNSFEDIYNSVRDKHVIVYGSQDAVTSLTAKKNDFFESSTEFAMIRNEHLTAHGSYFELVYGGKDRAYHTNLIGDYNVENVTAAILASLAVGIPDSVIRDGVSDVFVPGRLQLYHHDGAMFMVDYAHNHISMYRLFNMVKSTLKPDTITAVFGCGGERYKKRREDMGRLADEYADKIILTMEDPGFESCEDICNEIKQYITKPCTVITDREAAITKALCDAKPGELVVVTGKGIESTMRINGEFVPMHSDAQVIENWLAAH